MSSKHLPPPSNKEPLTDTDTITLYLVDDDPLVTSSLEAFLSLTFPDYRLQTFNNPEDALTHLLEDTPTLVVSDFLMPEMDGIQFLTNVREQLPETTVILLTGYADKENAIAAVNSANIFKYLEKPWNNDDLKQAITQGVERAQLLAKLRCTIGDLEEAKTALSQYSQQLEGIVAERTQDVQQALAHLEAIVRGSGDGIATIDGHGHVLTVNPTLLNWLGGTVADDILGHPLGQWLTIQQPLTTWLTSLGPEGLGETTLQPSQPHQSGGYPPRPIEISASLMAARDNEPADISHQQWVLICRDLTRRKAEDRLREDFVATLTHDLRVPLLAAIQTLGLLANGSLGELNTQQTDIANMLVTNNQDMLSLVNTLLDIYKYESGQKALLSQTVNLTELAHQVSQQMQALAESHQHTLTVQAQSEQLTVTGDRQELQRVMTNLVGNAIHHTPSGGKITIRVSNDLADGHIGFSVTDTGRGIPEGDLPGLFQRFVQGTSQVRSSGSGLGLYLCKHIIDRHGGHISVVSTTQSQASNTNLAGSTFTVALPNS